MELWVHLKSSTLVWHRPHALWKFFCHTFASLNLFFIGLVLSSCLPSCFRHWQMTLSNPVKLDVGFLSHWHYVDVGPRWRLMKMSSWHFTSSNQEDVLAVRVITYVNHPLFSKTKNTVITYFYSCILVFDIVRLTNFHLVWSARKKCRFIMFSQLDALRGGGMTTPS